MAEGETKELKLRVPASLHRRLVESARRNGSSVNQEAIRILDGMEYAMSKPEVMERKLREGIARLPLRQRQETAEAMGWGDGQPLTEDDFRKLIRGQRELGTSRDAAMRDLRPTEDVMERRIGSLDPVEFGQLFEQEWPSR